MIATVVAAAASGGSGPGSGPPAGTGTTTASDSALLGRLLTVDTHGNVVVRVSCTASAGRSCADSIAVYGTSGRLPAAAARSRHGPVKATRLARGHVNVGAGKTATLRLHLDAAGLKLARKHRRLAARLLLSLAGGAGPVTHAYTVTLRRSDAHG
jgi:hypothetical protein